MFEGCISGDMGRLFGIKITDDADRDRVCHFYNSLPIGCKITSPSVSLSINGEGGDILEGLRPLYICSELLRKVPPTAVYGLRPRLVREYGRSGSYINSEVEYLRLWPAETRPYR
jgi:hypothetical protein